MTHFRLFTSLFLLLTLSIPGLAADVPGKSGNPVVRLTTSLGIIDLELDAQKAPKTVANFLGYVDRGHYNGTLFHRVIPRFMIQGGGFTTGMQEKATGKPVQNEADNGLKNLTGTVAMARTQDPHSASAQFFINTHDNTALDHRDKSVRGWGYAVFGKVLRGMEVVRNIEQTATRRAGMFEDVPVKDVKILKAERLVGGKVAD